MDRIESLQTHKDNGTVPTALHLKNVVPKGKDVGKLHKKFGNIIRKAESKLLDSTLEQLPQDLTACRSTIDECHHLPSQH